MDSGVNTFPFFREIENKYICNGGNLLRQMTDFIFITLESLKLYINFKLNWGWNYLERGQIGISIW